MNSVEDVVMPETRTPLERGVVFLRLPGLPSLACALTGLKEMGCGCLVNLSGLEESIADSWSAQLGVSGTRVGVDLTVPPYLPGLHLESEIVSFTRGDSGELPVGLRFLEAEAEDLLLLKRAIAALKSDMPAAQGSALWKAVGADAVETPFLGKRVGEILVKLGKVPEAAVEEAAQITRAAHEHIGHYLVRRGFISPSDLCQALSLQSGLPRIDLAKMTPPAELLQSFSLLTMLRHNMIPFAQSEELVSLAVAKPLDRAALAEIARRCGRKLRVFLAEDDVIAGRLYALQPSQERRHRRQQRHGVEVPLCFQLGNQQTKVFQQSVHTGHAVNISEGGLCLRTVGSLRDGGGCLRVQIALPDGPLEGIYGVRYQAEQCEGTEADFISGLELLEMSPENRQRVKQFCNGLGLDCTETRGDHRDSKHLQVLAKSAV